MIITDEELLALLNSEETDERLFHPVTIYALDGVAYRTAKAVELPEFATLRRTRPDACWQWEGLFAAGAIALFDPDSHVGTDYLPQLTAQAEGVYRLTDDWLAGVNGRYLAWQEWLAQTQVLLLEDHPFQGAHIQQEIKELGVPCQWVQDGNACIKALAGGEVKLLVSDLSLVEQDAISLLMSQPQYQHSGLPIVLLSAHDQTLIDGARRLLHDAGFNVLAALAKPLLADDLLRLLKTLYLGPQRQRRLSGLRRTIRTWQGEEKGLLGLLSDPPSPLPIWLAVTGLPPRWERVREWLVQQGREPGELTLLIHRRDHLLSQAERFALVLQASLAGAMLALLLDNDQHIPFDLLERQPLQHLLLGQSLLPGLEAMTQDSLLGRFINRARELGIALYLDDPFNLLDSNLWRDQGVAGRWQTVARYLCWPPDEARLRRALAGWLHPHSRAALPLMMEVGGIPCRLQELAGADPERIRAAYGELSEQSVYLRFMRAKQIPSDEQLAFFLDYPKEHQIGLLLTDGQGRPLAQAQSIRRRLHPDRAEFSCIVADHFQHRGAGRRILLALALLARAEGIREWTAEVLPQNRPMLALLRGLGLPLTLVTGRELVFVRLDLSVLDTL